MTLQENGYEYNANSIFNFSMNDMLIKAVQFSISTLQFKSNMQYFTKCTNLMIKTQKTKIPSNVKCLLFVFSIY